MQSQSSHDTWRQVVIEQQDEIIRFQEQRYVERDQLQDLLTFLHKNWIKVITGIRRCGKSILAHQALQGTVYGYINFDDERLIGLRAKDLNKLFQFVLEIKPNAKFFFFDEIQNVPGWELFANRLQRQGYNLIITGSNSKLLSKELATHLTGRHISIELMPFSFPEFLKAKNFEWTHISLHKTHQQALLYSLLTEYLEQGGFPEMVVGGYNGDYLRELYDKIIARDITYRYHIKYSNTLKEIAIYCHNSLSSRMTFHKMKNNFEISSIHTVKNYFQYLQDAYLLFLLAVFSFKPKEQVKYPRKLYTIDNGLSAAINPSFAKNRGVALENLVFQELYRRKSDFSYYATPDLEVDFVVYQNRQVSTLIQVAWSIEDAQTKQRELKALLKAAPSLKCNNLSIITWEEEGIEKIDGYTVAILPVWKWLLKL